jgi:hypothetical protein
VEVRAYGPGPVGTAKNLEAWVQGGYTKRYGGFADEEGLMEIWHGNCDVSIP